MTAIEQIIAIAEQLGWQVKTDTDNRTYVVFDFLAIHTSRAGFQFLG